MRLTHRHILLVEDNPDDEALIVRSLKKFDSIETITVAHDGQSALDLLFGTDPDRKPLKPCVVFLDIKLPKLNGLEVLRQVRNHPLTHHLPVVMLTSSDEESDLEDCYRLGVNSYVCKPVSFSDLRDTVGLLGNYWVTKNRVPASQVA